MRPCAKYLAEFLGTAMLLCAVIGSGIMAENLSAGNQAIALLANTLATVFALYVLIETLGNISGAHFNPAVSLVMWCKNALTAHELAAYVAVQLLGAVAGAWLAHAMFDLEVFQLSTQIRTGLGQWISEVVATAGLLLVILRAHKDKAAALVACYIGAAYWFTASTSFANPAAVFGRMLSHTFAGINPVNALCFVLAECLGALLGFWVSKVLDRFGSEAPRNV